MSSFKAILGTMIAPGWLDHLLCRRGYDGRLSSQPPSEALRNLFEPVAEGHATNGRFDGEARAGVVCIKPAVLRAAGWLAGVPSSPRPRRPIGGSSMREAEQALLLERDGAERIPAAICADELTALLQFSNSFSSNRAGTRVFDRGEISHSLEATGSVGRHASAVLGEAARPVRAILFDKTAENNWAVPWHQDRTIAVRARLDVPGFAPWSVKSSVVHVEPPFAVIAGMVTIRVHLDDCDSDNAPLLIAPGSHRLGRVAAQQTAETARRLGHAVCLANHGDIWLYATSIIHASDPARHPRRRRVLQVDYANRRLPGGLEWLGITDSASADRA